MERTAKPCANCPFRQDIEAWQSQRCLDANIFRLENPECIAHCHKTTFINAETPRPGKRVLVCAGFLLMRLKLDLLGACAEAEEDTSMVFDSIKHFARAVAGHPKQLEQLAAYQRNEEKHG